MNAAMENELRRALKEALKRGAYEDALVLMRRVSVDDDLSLLQYVADRLDKLPKSVIEDADNLVRKRLAVLGGATTEFITPLIRLFALSRGVWLETYESGYGLFEQEIRSDSSDLRAFEPDVIHFHTSSHNLVLPINAQEAEALGHEQAERFLGLYRAAHEQFGCSLIVNNFDTFEQHPFGNLEGTIPHAANRFVRRINEALLSELPAECLVHDIEHLSSVAGKRLWHDPSYWDSAKLAVSFPCQPLYAHALAATISALFGKSKKCLVLDLDNTLWGGVIGDDGMDGIVLGEGDPQGEAFLRFQKYAKTLQQRGILLAVASKNEMANALEPFRDHPDMVLRESDISSFRANWMPKDGNIVEIAQELNIGLDSLVFFDDNPAERDLVRSGVPDVTVVEVPDDPAEYVRCLDRARLFDTVSVTGEDAVRAEFFQQNRKRERLAGTSGNYDDYLLGLQMVATVAPVDEGSLARVTQLVNKTNQFNLRTQRMTAAEIRELAENEQCYTSTIRLQDKFGDAGLISVVTGTIHDGVLSIGNWLMSCRVLKRGVEVVEMECILEFCRKRGLEAIEGMYLPTAKNALVSQHYAELGFSEQSSAGPGTHWRLELDRPDPELVHWIERRRTE
jgi:FkbH-like protein